MYFKNIDDTNYPNPNLYSKYRNDASYNQAQYQYFKNAYSTEYPSVAECDDWNCVLSILKSECQSSASTSDEYDRCSYSSTYALPYEEEVKYAIEYYGYILEADSGETVTDTCEVTVTFKNLNANQSINVGKKIDTYIFFESLKDYESVTPENLDSNWKDGVLKNNNIIE